MNRTIEHFNDRAAEYDKRAKWVRNPKLMRAILKLLAPTEGMNILDVGAGTSAVLNELITKHPKVGLCVALDISKEMLKRIHNPIVQRVQGDGAFLPFRSSLFDLILCRQSLHYISNIQSTLRAFHQTIVSGGALVIGQITPFNERDERYWKKIIQLRQPLRKHFFTINDLITLIKGSGFNIASIFQISETDSLNSWVSRYSMSERSAKEFREMHFSAPKTYKSIHRFRKRDDDLLYDKCWTLIRAIKDEGFNSNKR